MPDGKSHTCECGQRAMHRWDGAAGRSVSLGVCFECREAQLQKNGCVGYVAPGGMRFDKKAIVYEKPGGGPSYARDDRDAAKEQRKRERKAERTKARNRMARMRREAERSGQMPGKLDDDFSDLPPLTGDSIGPSWAHARLRKRREDKKTQGDDNDSVIEDE